MYLNLKPPRESDAKAVKSFSAWDNHRCNFVVPEEQEDLKDIAYCLSTLPSYSTFWDGNGLAHGLPCYAFLREQHA